MVDELQSLGLLKQEDMLRIKRMGFGRRVGGGERPAVIVIDAQEYMVHEPGGPGTDYPSSCGKRGKEGIEGINLLCRAARQHGVPICFSKFVVSRNGNDMGVYRLKRGMPTVEGWCIEGTAGAELAKGLEVGEEDWVFEKRKPSAFFGTPLLSYLINASIDTLIVVGGSTSNCVRATVVDGASFNYRVLVPRECVFDRIEVSEKVALLDIDRQYGDVIAVQDAIEYVTGCESGVALKE